MATSTLQRIADGRTDLVLEHLAAGGAAVATDPGGVSLAQWCAYYGDVSALRALLEHGAMLTSLGDDLGIHAAAFHGHWQLCEFLLEHRADPNHTQAGTHETPLHDALCSSDRSAHDRVIAVLLARGADPNRATKPGIETGSFMRDYRTRGETPLHRAAAFGSEHTLELLIAAGAQLDARDAQGDSPLSWASAHLRPDSILRRLCFGSFRIHPEHKSMRENLLGTPHSS